MLLTKYLFKWTCIQKGALPPGMARLPLAPWLSLPVTAAEGGEPGLEAEAGAVLT